MRGLDPPAGPKPLRRGEGPRIHRSSMNLSKKDGWPIKPGHGEFIDLSREFSDC
jgi:hypothetical protein